MAVAAWPAETTFATPIRPVVWAIWRCRLDSSTHVVVDHTDGADPGGGQIQDQRRAKAAGADHQHARRSQLGLADAAHLLQQDVAGVALDFVFGEIEVHDS